MAPARQFVVLVNPAAGSVDDGGGVDSGAGGDDAAVEDGPLRPVLEELERHGRVRVITVDDDTAVRRGIDEAADDAVLVVVGGDGTIHRVINADTDRRRPYLLVPGGTGNDFVGGLGIPDDVGQAAGLVHGPAHAVDLIVGPGVHVMNAAHLGIGVQAAEAAADLKETFGRLAYATGALTAAVDFEPVTLTASVDGETVVSERPVALLAVCNGTRIGGGTRICPEADPTDGLLDVVVLLADTRARLAPTTAALLRGEHLDRDDVRWIRGQHLDVTAHHAGTAVWNVDGEIVELAATLRWAIQPGAWRLHGPQA